MQVACLWNLNEIFSQILGLLTDQAMLLESQGAAHFFLATIEQGSIAASKM
jgi:hypothetical protein